MTTNSGTGTNTDLLTIIMRLIDLHPHYHPWAVRHIQNDLHHLLDGRPYPVEQWEMPNSNRSTT